MLYELNILCRAFSLVFVFQVAARIRPKQAVSDIEMCQWNVQVKCAKKVRVHAYVHMPTSLFGQHVCAQSFFWRVHSLRVQGTLTLLCAVHDDCGHLLERTGCCEHLCVRHCYCVVWWCSSKDLAWNSECCVCRLSSGHLLAIQYQ